MPEATRSETAVPTPRRHEPNKLAVLCARRPLLYVLVRVWATLTALLTLTFVADAVFALGGLMALQPVVFFLVNDGQILGADERDALVAGISGLPFDMPRLGLLALCAVALVATELLATRGLGGGTAAAQNSIVHGMPWPGRWETFARTMRRARPGVIAAAAVVGTGALVPILGWPDRFSDQLREGAGLIAIAAFAAGLMWLAGKGGSLLINLVPSHVGVSWQAVNEARDEISANDAAEALGRWPPLPPLRLRAAIRVFNDPPHPMRRGERRRQAWWNGTETSVESLATELVVQSLIEARERGLLSLSPPHRNPVVRGSLPASRQPTGLAALVTGHHREGDTEGRRVSARLSRVLDAVYGVDQYARVLETALHDLAAEGIAQNETDGWQLSRQRLELAAAALREDDVARPVPGLSRRATIRLRRSVARKLRRKRTTDAQAGGLFSTIAAIVTISAERSRRHTYALPGDRDKSAENQSA